MNRKAKILVVDDASEVVVLCTNMLRALGYTVKGASRGDDAVALVRQEPFDLVIVDYKMPEMNGFEVFEAARAVRPDLAFVLLTGHGSPDVVEDATEMGFHAILLKPFTRDQLRASVDQVLAGRERS